MSTPFRERDDDQPSDGRSDRGPLTYAPKRPRLPRADPDKELGKLNAAPASKTTESPDPPWLRKDRPGAFVADLDSVELRNRLGRDDRVLEPPLPDSSGSMLTAAQLVTLVAVMAVGVTAGAMGYRWSMVPPTSSTQQQPAHRGAKIVDMTALASPAPVESPQPPRRNNDQHDAQLATTGLASWPFPSPASTPPAPTSTAPTSTAPLGGQGLPEPAAAPSPQQPNAGQIAVMVKRGGEFMANGNIGAARVMLRPAAEAGNARAAFALAETYDPFVLERLGAKGGITSDVELARRWYEAAKNLGSATAPDRLVALAGRSQ
jgi:hypothetical protein